MLLNDTTLANFWQPPSGWSAVTPTATQTGTLLEQEWSLHVYRYCDDLPCGSRWLWCRYLCLEHITTPPSRWTFDTEGYQS
jgi:hypothetical protein